MELRNWKFCVGWNRVDLIWSEICILFATCPQVLRQTTLPSVPTRHQTFQRQLSHRLDLDDVPFTVCTLEPKHSLGHIMVSVEAAALYISLNSVYRRTISRPEFGAKSPRRASQSAARADSKSNRSCAALHNYFSRRWWKFYHIGAPLGGEEKIGSQNIYEHKVTFCGFFR